MLRRLRAVFTPNKRGVRHQAAILANPRAPSINYASLRGKADPHGLRRVRDNSGSVAKVQLLFEAIQRVDKELSRRTKGRPKGPYSYVFVPDLCWFA